MASHGAEQAHWIARSIAHTVFHLSTHGTPWIRRLVSRKTQVEVIRSESLEITTPDGVKLGALHIPAAPSAAPRLPIVMSHGWMEVKEIHLRNAQMLAATGHEVLLYDMRCHGQSIPGRGHDNPKGKFCFGALEMQDNRWAIDEMQRRGWAGNKVITMGYSTSASLALMHAPTDERVAGVVAFAPYASLAEPVDTFRIMIFRHVPAEWLHRGFRAAAVELGFKVEDQTVERAIRELRVPTLLVSGDRDIHLPTERHTRYLSNLGSPEFARYVEIKGAGHLSIVRKHWPALDEEVKAFCATVSAQHPR